MTKIVNYDFYKKRVVDEKIETYLNTVGAICIERPKWCGNTRTSSFHAKKWILFTDPSLACALLKLTPTKLIHDLNTFGFLFESLAERDLRIYADSFGGTLYHYQDYNDKEIDAVIELDDGTWCAFEIKLGSYQIDSAAKNLLKIKEKIEQDGGIPPKILCVIVGIGSAFYQRDDGVFVVPITALKN